MLFFFQYTAIGAYFVYLNVYLRQAGLSGTQIGVLNMSSSIIGVVSALIWGYISDRTGKPRILIAVGAVGSLITVQFIPLVHTFWAFFAIACLGAVLSSSLTTLVDGVTLAMLGSMSENYGRFRLGGSIGYILASSTSGFIYDRTGLGLIFPVYGVLMGCFALIALLLPDIPVKVERRATAQIGANDPPTCLGHFCTVRLPGLDCQLFQHHVPGRHLAEHGRQPEPDRAGFHLRRPDRDPLHGVQRLVYPQDRTEVPDLIVAIVLMVMRFLLLAWMPTPNLAFYINILNGPAYGLFATCIVAFAKNLAPPTLNVTSQGLLNSTINLAGVVSALMTGVLFDRIGPQKIFLVMAACCLVGLALFGLGALQRKSEIPGEEPT